VRVYQGLPVFDIFAEIRGKASALMGIVKDHSPISTALFSDISSIDDRQLPTVSITIRRADIGLNREPHLRAQNSESW